MKRPMPRRSNQVPPTRRGFTLIELLVVMAIIGLLIAMLMPAIQNARESQRKMECNSNLRQIGIAFNIYHDAKGTFPPGVLDDPANPLSSITTNFVPALKIPINNGTQLYSLSNFAVSPWWGWHAFILNDLGMGTIPVAFAYDTNGNRIGSDLQSMRTTIKIYTCPTASLTPNNERFAYSSYRGSCGSTMTWGTDTNGVPAWVANTDSNGNPYCDGGLFFSHSANGHRDMEHDGAANVIMAGESQFGFWGDGYTCCAGERADKPSVFDFQPDPWGFGSSHKDSVNFLFGDVSAKPLNKRIDRDTFRKLVVRNDGQNPGNY